MPEDSPTPQDDSAGGNRLRRLLLGWVLVPALIIGALFAAGVHVGARHPDMLLTRAVLWLGGGEVERPPQRASEPAGAEALPSAASQPPELIRLHFGWPAPAQAIVEQTIEEPGNNAKLRYRIEVERQGEKLLVHHRDPRVLELQGQPIDSDSNAAEIEGHLLLAGFIPSIVVAADGEFDRVIDMDAYIERTREALAASPEEHDAIAAIMNSPKMQWTLEHRIVDIWRGWAEMWIELELMSDQGLRFESHEGVGEYRVLGFDAQTVSLEFRLDHKLTKSELHDMFGTVARVEGKEDPWLDAELEAATGGKDLVATVTLRRDTMLPLSSSNQLDIWVEFSGESRRTRRQLTRYTFEWQ
jgi:hypothetical protein